MPQNARIGPITDHELTAVDEFGAPVSLAIAQAHAALHHCTQQHARDQFLTKIAMALECDLLPVLTDAGHDRLVQFVRTSPFGRAYIWQRSQDGKITL